MGMPRVLALEKMDTIREHRTARGFESELSVCFKVRVSECTLSSGPEGIVGNAGCKIEFGASAGMTIFVVAAGRVVF